MKTDKRNVILGLLVVVLSGSIFGYALKIKNLSFYSTELIRFLPWMQWIDALAFWSLVALTVFLLDTAFFAVAFSVKKKELFLANSLSYLLSILFFFNIPIHLLFIFFLLSKIPLIYLHRKKFSQTTKKVFPHLSALLLIGISQATFNDFVSPSAWNNPIASLNQWESNYIGPSSSGIIYDYKNAKLFDFSSFDHSFWGSMPHNTSSGSSVVVPLLVNLFNLSIIDYESQARILLILIFSSCVLASFAFYCFLHFGLNLNRFVSLLGGFCFVISNVFLADQFTQHFPLFVTPYLMLPFALLFSCLAFQKQKPSLGFFAGLLFSLHFYIYLPHADTIIHATLFWISYLFFQLISNKTIPFKVKDMRVGVNTPQPISH